MMKTNNKTKAAFDAAIEPKAKPQLRLVREEELALPLYATMSTEEYRQWQYKQQCLQLAENLKNAASPATLANTQQQHQIARRSAADEDTIARQASIQENSGSIFSTAFYHC